MYMSVLPIMYICAHRGKRRELGAAILTLGTELRSSARAACALNLVSLLRTLTLFLPYLSVSWQGGRRSTDRDFIPWKVLSTFLGPQHLTSTPNLLSLSHSTVGVAPLEGQPHCAFFFFLESGWLQIWFK